MDTPTIVAIREARDSIRAEMKSLDRNSFSGQKFGGENEFTYKGILGGIESLLIDVSALTQAPLQFTKSSTYSERNTIHSLLLNISSYLQSPQSLIQYVDALKVQIRQFNLRDKSERFVEFSAEIDRTIAFKGELEGLLSEARRGNEVIAEIKQTAEGWLEDSQSHIETLESKISDAQDNCKRSDAKATEVQQLFTRIEEIKEDAEQELGEIRTLLTEAKADEKLISSFASRVQERESKLNEIEIATLENKKKLEEYEAQRVEIVKEANSLIESAKQALGYKTAEGISAAFREQYNEIKSSKGWSWLIGAAVCLIATISLGIWVLSHSTNTVALVIGRVALLPLPVLGTVFCANQYVRQKNLLIDYAYKMVLSKSIVGFSEQIRKNGKDDCEEYVHYMKTVLREIHRDPLRDRDSKHSSRKENQALALELAGLAEKLLKISKSQS